MPLQAARQFKLQQNGQKDRGCQSALTQDFVDAYGRRAQLAGHQIAAAGDLGLAGRGRRGGWEELGLGLGEPG